MKKSLLAALCVACVSCSQPNPDLQVIVGARLEPGGGQPALEHSVLVISDGKFQAVGPQQTTPVPKGAEVTRGIGKLVTPSSEAGVIAAGKPADLILRDASTLSVEKTMHDGKWF